MRTWRRVVACAFAIVVVMAGELSAHGLTVVVERTGDVWVAMAHYDGGVPVAGGDVVIHGPDTDSVYQVGRTDPAGRFAFVPAGPGEWRVRVDDGMGHRRTARTTVAAEQAAPAEAEVTEDQAGDARGETGPWRLATGLSLLFGLTGFAYGFTSRTRSGTA
jgi:nickel transport protein